MTRLTKTIEALSAAPSLAPRNVGSHRRGRTRLGTAANRLHSGVEHARRGVVGCSHDQVSIQCLHEQHGLQRTGEVVEKYNVVVQIGLFIGYMSVHVSALKSVIRREPVRDSSAYHGANVPRRTIQGVSSGERSHDGSRVVLLWRLKKSGILALVSCMSA